DVVAYLVEVVSDLVPEVGETVPDVAGRTGDAVPDGLGGTAQPARAQAGRVRVRLGAVVAVRVPVQLLWIVGVQDRVGGDEPPGERVVLARPEVHQSGRVDDAADEPLVAGQRHRCAARTAVRRLVPARHLLPGAGDRDQLAALPVAHQPAHAGRRAHRPDLAAERVVPGGRDLSGRVGQPQFHRAQVERGTRRVAGEQAVACRVVDVAGRSGAVGERVEVALDVPGEGLRAGRTGPGQGVAGRVVA